MGLQIHKFVAKNDAGDILLRIELAKIIPSSTPSFTCTVEIESLAHLQVTESFESIWSPDKSPAQKAGAVHQLLSTIKTIEPVEEVVLKSEYSSMEEALIFIALQDELGEFVPLSETHNKYYFKDVVNRLSSCEMDMVEIEKSFFEKVLAGHPYLEDEYVNYYSANASFFAALVLHHEVCYQFYLMKTDQIHLIFFEVIN